MKASFLRISATVKALRIVDTMRARKASAWPGRGGGETVAEHARRT